MSNVNRNWWNRFAKAIHPRASHIAKVEETSCSCLSHSARQAFGRLPDCVSIHSVTGNALWVSDKALGTFCFTAEELSSYGLKNLLEKNEFFDFGECLEKSIQTRSEEQYEVKVNSGRMNTILTMRFIPMEQCECENCQQMVMVISSPIKDNTVAGLQKSEPVELRQPNYKSSPQPLDLIGTARLALGRFSKNHGVKTTLVSEGDETDIPTINADKLLLELLLEQLYLLVKDANVADQEASVDLFIRRQARTVCLTFAGTNKRGVTTLPNAFCSSGLDVTKVRPDMATLPHKLAGLLGAKLRFTEQGNNIASLELILPINARIALPAPESIAAEIVRIPRAANLNTNAIPIPRNYKTG